MTVIDWAKLAGRYQGEKHAMLFSIKQALEVIRTDPDFARIVLDAIVLAVEETDAANDNVTPKARA